METESRVIPFFPLPVAVIPGEVIPLHIFEPRYKSLMEDCRNDHIEFGIPFVREGKLESFGALMQLERIKRVYRNGTLDVEVRCTGTFELHDFRDPMPGKEYSGGEVRPINLSTPWPDQNLKKLFLEYADLVPELGIDREDAADFYAIARALSLDHAAKYAIITPAADSSKLIALENELKLAIQIRRQANLISDNFHLN